MNLECNVYNGMMCDCYGYICGMSRVKQRKKVMVAKIFAAFW